MAYVLTKHTFKVLSEHQIENWDLMEFRKLHRASLLAQQVKNLPAMQETQGMQVPSRGQEDPLEKEWQSLQYSCLKIPMNRGAWWTTVQWAAESRN